MDACVNRILDLMKSKGLNQKALAERLNMRQQTITEWKNGTTKSYRSKLPELSEILGTTTDYILYGEKKEPITVSNDGQSARRAALIAKINLLNEDDLELIEAQAELLIKRQHKK